MIASSGSTWPASCWRYFAGDPKEDAEDFLNIIDTIFALVNPDILALQLEKAPVCPYSDNPVNGREERSFTLAEKMRRQHRSKTFAHVYSSRKDVPLQCRHARILSSAFIRHRWRYYFRT
jgi:hypothetical protein